MSSVLSLPWDILSQAKQKNKVSKIKKLHLFIFLYGKNRTGLVAFLKIIFVFKIEIIFKYQQLSVSVPVQNILTKNNFSFKNLIVIYILKSKTVCLT